MKAASDDYKGYWEVRALDNLGADSFRDEWCRATDAHGDAYHDLAYLKACQAIKDGPVLLCRFRCDMGAVYRSFVMRPIPLGLESGSSRPHYDIISPFEYGGPFAVPNDPRSIDPLVRASEAAFAVWCRERAIVCEFVRFSPVLNNAETFACAYETAVSCDNIAIDLDRPEDDLFAGYTASQRRNCRKAERMGVSVHREVKSAARIEEFRDLYTRSMVRAGASDYYYFNGEFFQRLGELPDELLSLYVARSAEGEALAGVLFLRNARFAHSYLLGSSDAGSRFCANNLLYHAAAVDLRRDGVDILHMGGRRLDAARRSGFQGTFFRPTLELCYRTPDIPERHLPRTLCGFRNCRRHRDGWVLSTLPAVVSPRPRANGKAIFFAMNTAGMLLK